MSKHTFILLSNFLGCIEVDALANFVVCHFERRNVFGQIAFVALPSPDLLDLEDSSIARCTLSFCGEVHFLG